MRIYNSHYYEVAGVRQSMPRFRFRGDMPFEKWQSAARDRLKSLLCMPQNRGECRVDALTRKLHDGFIEYRFQVETESNFYTQCYLLTPDDKKEAHKLCICFGGHGSNMHITAGLPDNDVNRAEGELCALEKELFYFIVNHRISVKIIYFLTTTGHETVHEIQLKIARKMGV